MGKTTDAVVAGVRQAANTQALEQGYAAGVLPARVKFSGRGFMSNACEMLTFLVFLGGVAAYFGILVFFHTESNITFFANSTFVMSSELATEFSECTTRTAGRRLLAGAQACDLFCLFSEEPAIPLVTIGGAPLFAFVWVLALYKFSKTMTWFAVIFNIAIYALLGLLLVTEGATEAGLILCGFSALWAALTFCYRSKVFMAARHLKTATTAISHNLSLFVAVGILEGAMLATVASFWFSLVESAKIWTVEEIPQVGCFIAPDIDKTSNLIKAQGFLLLWITRYFNSTKLITTAMVIGSWFFDQDDKPMSTSLSALKSSLVTSGPVTSVGSLITALVEWIIRQATSNFWFLDPLGIFLRLVYCCVQSCIIALTRFALVAHAFTGDSFFGSSKSVYEVMKKNFSGAYVVSRVGQAVMTTGCSIGAIGLGMVAWSWLDAVNNTDTLSDLMDTFDGSVLLILLFFLAYLYLVKRPMFTLLAISLLMNTIKTFFGDASGLNVPAETWPPLGSLFVGSIAMIIISFVGDVVMDALDTIFLSFAVANDNGLGKPTTGDRSAIYALLDDGLVPEAKVVPT